MVYLIHPLLLYIQERDFHIYIDVMPIVMDELARWVIVRVASVIISNIPFVKKLS